MKKLTAILMTAVLLFSLNAPALAANTATGTTLRLEKTEGSVAWNPAAEKL